MEIGGEKRYLGYPNDFPFLWIVFFLIKKYVFYTAVCSGYVPQPFSEPVEPVRRLEAVTLMSTISFLDG